MTKSAEDNPVIGYRSAPHGSRLRNAPDALLAVAVRRLYHLVSALFLILALAHGGMEGIAQAAKPGRVGPYGAHTAFVEALLDGARGEVARRTRYKSVYYAGGFPPDGEGVCTDVIWRAFKAAGYDLKGMMDADIRKNGKEYSRIRRHDPNIDFRRVPNQTVFFRRHAQALTTRMDEANRAAWQPGDIVIFANPDHIAILSEKCNAEGIPLLVHNQGPFATEGDDFMAWYRRGIVGHFRFMPHNARTRLPH